MLGLSEWNPLLLPQPEHYDVPVLSSGTVGTSVTKDGKRRLASLIGTEEIKKNYVKEKKREWLIKGKRGENSVRHSPDWAAGRLTAYSAYTHDINIGGPP